jgi:hypothetical protein
MTEQQQLEAVISALDAQRALIGDALVDASLAPLRARLAALIAPVSPAAQVIKQVTILFLDVVGSTALSQNLDAQDIYAVRDGARWSPHVGFKPHGSHQPAARADLSRAMSRCRRPTIRRMK